MPFQPHKLQAVVFDMDGVLIDSEALYLKTSVQSAKELGFELSEDLYKSVIGMPDKIGQTLIREGMGPNFPIGEYYQRLSANLKQEFEFHVPVKTGVRELLSLLKELNLPIAVATSNTRKTVEHHFTRAELLPYFKTIVTSDDVNLGKPDPEPYLLASKSLGVDPKNCLALEDSHNGVRSAHAAGMQTVMVPDMLPATDEIAKLCVGVMSDLHAIRERFLAT